jgi:hypothetical protein
VLHSILLSKPAPSSFLPSSLMHNVHNWFSGNTIL